MTAPIVLASASPRRKQLLEAACFTVEVRPSNADETWPGGSPREAAVEIARRKLITVPPTDGFRLAADTVVVLHDSILGKPASKEHAVEMLRSLSGRPHQVITGFVVGRGDRVEHGAVTTQVCFRALTEVEIARYVESGEPMDKAGSYGIQGLGGALVSWMEGSYTNVVGLPLAEVLQAINHLRGGLE